uniref:Uncharacterized protein n=1 Tax=Parascaris equorum TaxID=6256 RepID=A0A914RGW2_PAREQ
MISDRSTVTRSVRLIQFAAEIVITNVVSPSSPSSYHYITIHLRLFEEMESARSFSASLFVDNIVRPSEKSTIMFLRMSTSISFCRNR